MWRCASSLELLPNGVRNDLGETLVNKVKKKDYSASDLWCISRLGARKLFYGPNNQVLPANTVTRWLDVLLKAEKATDALLSLSRITGDAARDLSPATIELVKRALGEEAHRLESEEQDMGRVFGEDLPSGFVFQSHE